MNSNEVVSSKRSLASHLVDYVRKTRQADSASKNPPSKRGKTIPPLDLSAHIHSFQVHCVSPIRLFLTIEPIIQH